MTLQQKGYLAKAFQAIGIASVMIGLIQGTYGSDMWGELYFFLGGILLFLIGRRMEKKLERANIS